MRLTTRGSSRFELVVGNPVDHQALARRPARQRREASAALARTFRDPDQQDHLAPGDDRPGIEDPDDLEIVTQGLADRPDSKATAQNAAVKSMQGSFPIWMALSLGQPVGGAGDGQRVPAVLLGDLPLVRMVTDPGELVGHDRPEQLAVTM